MKDTVNEEGIRSILKTPIVSSVRGEAEAAIPLSRFRSMDELETLVRLLGADNE